MAVAVTGRPSKTRAELITLLADAFGDFLVLTATALGTTTTMFDTERITNAGENLDGREITFQTGTNANLTRMITDCDDSLGKITFAAVTGAVASGVIAHVVNRTGTGFKRVEYIRGLNRAILSAGTGLVPIIAVMDDPFSKATGIIEVPETTREVYRVEWQDNRDIWQEIRRAPRVGMPGWSAVRGTGTIRIYGQPAQIADNRTIKLWGYGRQAELSTDADECALNHEYLIAHAAFTMASGALPRKPELSSLIPMFRDLMIQYKSRVRLIRHPHTQAVW